ncbi:PcfJ domain-containing protein [Mesorhizobium sp. M2A.F.Ca.ET.039.01.1.1]|uniref:PcfJ domain-containing protein n=1 Tax=Mesorhizobium sp. M2A.F.Ca.ET.039.01.1.1 TaxID=2496746 RepID=UPI000FCB6485|nr:PcfJ domain-containing protein [Mesorhizobium sp. M2A.F.Ca.ET.039.01.1.1]RWX72507.1 hypothetical protein EOA24_00505 [Mesorhizobium sp. M2A.F.Ca.ET.039.01.1.1]
MSETLPSIDTSWEGDAMVRARQLYPNQGVERLAVLMARTHRYAIQYLEQCPALIVFAPWGVIPRRPHERVMVANRFGSAVNRGLKLRDMLAEFNGPLQVRALTGSGCIPSNFQTILALRQIAPSTLAQAIPPKSGEQVVWLRFLRNWKQQNDMLLAGNETKRRASWEWAAKTVSVAIRDGMKNPEDHIRQIIDMLRYGTGGLNPDWSFRSAIAATERWHADLAKEKSEKDFLARQGFGFDDRRDYGPLPETWVEGSYEFTALQSGRDLFIEGKAMHHCVSSYVRHVMLGGTRIYSIRNSQGDRVATMELHPRGELYVIAQLKGPCNRRPLKSVQLAAESFLHTVNALIVAGIREGRTVIRSSARKGGR